MFKYTKTNLKKLETLFEELKYNIRYEKGNFNAGYCIVERKKIAVINKFFDTEGRINCLLDILGKLEVSSEQLSEKSSVLFRQLKKLQAKDEN